MQIDPITIKPDVCAAEPTIRGMRITVSDVLEILPAGSRLTKSSKTLPTSKKPTSTRVLSMRRVMRTRQLYLFEAAGRISAIEASAVQYDHAELRPCVKRHTNTPLRQRRLFCSEEN